MDDITNKTIEEVKNFYQEEIKKLDQEHKKAIDTLNETINKLKIEHSEIVKQLIKGNATKVQDDDKQKEFANSLIKKINKIKGV